MEVAVFSFVVHCLSEGAFYLEAGLFVGFYRCGVVYPDVKLDAVEVEGVEAVFDYQPGGFAAVALSPALRVEQRDKENQSKKTPTCRITSNNIYSSHVFTGFLFRFI